MFLFVERVFSDKDHDTLITLTDRLYNTLDRSNLLGKNCKRRSAILKTVYHLLDAESPEYLLKLAQLILSVCICVVIVIVCDYFLPNNTTLVLCTVLSRI